MSGTASRSGYDSSADRFRGQMTELAGKLTKNKAMELAGKSQREQAEAQEREILEPWHRERRAES